MSMVVKPEEGHLDILSEEGRAPSINVSICRVTRKMVSAIPLQTSNLNGTGTSEPGLKVLVRRGRKRAIPAWAAEMLRGHGLLLLLEALDGLAGLSAFQAKPRVLIC